MPNNNYKDCKDMGIFSKKYLKKLVKESDFFRILKMSL